MINSRISDTFVDIKLDNSITDSEKHGTEHIDLKLKYSSGENMNMFGQPKLGLKIGNKYFDKLVKIVSL